MSTECSPNNAPLRAAIFPTAVLRESLCALALMLTAHTCDSLAADSVVFAGSAPVRPDFNTDRPTVDWSAPAALSGVPTLFQPVDLPPSKIYSAQEFRPRGQSLLEKSNDANSVDDAPMLKSTTVWQRLSDYRSRDRVRVLTLWETGGSSLSLQAGRKGNPSLQWTSRLMNHGGATRGLLDHFIATSMASANRNLHVPSHTTAESPAPIKFLETANAPVKERP